MEEDDTRYQEYRIWPIGGYHVNISGLGFSPLESVSFEMEESMTGWSKFPRLCVSCIIILSIISIREGFLPDYLDAMLERIRDISDILDDEERVCYQDDLRTLEVLKQHVPYTVIQTNTSFMSEVESLLWPSVLKPGLQQSHPPILYG